MLGSETLEVTIGIIFIYLTITIVDYLYQNATPDEDLPAAEGSIA
jgi:hypothetical protein